MFYLEITSDKQREGRRRDLGQLLIENIKNMLTQKYDMYLLNFAPWSVTFCWLQHWLWWNCIPLNFLLPISKFQIAAYCHITLKSVNLLIIPRGMSMRAILGMLGMLGQSTTGISFATFRLLMLSWERKILVSTFYHQHSAYYSHGKLVLLENCLTFEG